MNDLQVGFDYGLLDQITATQARAAAERIKIRMKRTAEDIIEIGRDLQAVKADLGHGHFGKWIDAEFGFTAMTAQRFIQVADRFGKSNIMLDFKPTILYALAAPSTPDEVIDQAKAKAASGEPVTGKDVAEWKAAAEEAKTRLEEAKAERDLFGKRADEWRAQALAEKKEKEAAKAMADKMVSSQERDIHLRVNAAVAPIKADLDLARIDKAEAEAKLKDKTKAMAEQIANGIKQGLQAQQDEINRREAQLQAIEGRIATLNARLDAVNEQDQAVAHFDAQAREIRKSMDALSLHLTHTFDQDFAKFLPEPFLPVFERLATELLKAADDIRKALGYVQVRALEVAVHE